MALVEHEVGMNQPGLDQPQVLRLLFHPRPEYALGLLSPQARSVSIDVEPGISIGGRLYSTRPGDPAILYWHGNGEIAADYHAIGPMYTRLGITLLVIDYRGYGTSDGSPTCSNLLSDAITLFDTLDRVFQDHQLTPSRLYVMGRSLGSAAAIEVARHAGDQLAGLIIESGFADTFALLARLGMRAEEADEALDGFANAAKMGLISVPTLIIHGRNDVLIPATDGQELLRRSAAKYKRLVLIPDAGHNDLMLVGEAQYFEAIRTFVVDCSGGEDP